jgi:hypothetical protein
MTATLALGVAIIALALGIMSIQLALGVERRQREAHKHIATAITEMRDYVASHGGDRDAPG